MQGKVKWGVAGRSREKLADLITEISQILGREVEVRVSLRCLCRRPPGQEIPTIVADISDRPSVDAMVHQAEVVIACAGPFPKYSDIVAEACVKEGTHFLDVTGLDLLTFASA